MKEKKSLSIKAVVLLLAVVLLIGGTIGGTLAWLVTKTDSVTNTFTAGNISIDLKETTESYKMIPGTSIDKDPKVIFTADSEACWLFVKVEAGKGVMLGEVTGAKSDTYITYMMATGWNPVDGETGVYYRQLNAQNKDASYQILADNKVHVPDSVTKAMMDAVDAGTAAPTLTFTAYAVQQSGFSTAAAAWAEAKTLN